MRVYTANVMWDTVNVMWPQLSRLATDSSRQPICCSLFSPPFSISLSGDDAWKEKTKARVVEEAIARKDQAEWEEEDKTHDFRWERRTIDEIDGYEVDCLIYKDDTIFAYLNFDDQEAE